jgi:hypothetical protein
VLRRRHCIHPHPIPPSVGKYLDCFIAFGLYALPFASYPLHIGSDVDREAAALPAAGTLGGGAKPGSIGSGMDITKRHNGMGTLVLQQRRWRLKCCQGWLQQRHAVHCRQAGCLLSDSVGHHPKLKLRLLQSLFCDAILGYSIAQRQSCALLPPHGAAHGCCSRGRQVAGGGWRWHCELHGAARRCPCCSVWLPTVTVVGLLRCGRALPKDSREKRAELPRYA